MTRTPTTRLRRLGAVLLPILLSAGLAGCEDTTESTQTGYRGTGMVQFTSPATREALALANAIPEAQPPASDEGPRASELYENVQVLGHLSDEEFLRTMTAITEWVAPEEGCGYCHNLENLADDSVYTKAVARRMFQMTWAINDTWKPHVQETGVTCYTCHRGQPVPANVWFQNPGPQEAQGMARTDTGQNLAEPSIGLTSLPYDPFTTLFADPAQIRVASTTRLPSGSDKTIQQTEKTYSLMVHMSEGLGVNCTFCHNTQSFSSWDLSSPQRVTAWHGIRMVSDINGTYIDPLAGIFPDTRKGPLGDPYKANCTTCHQGASKPLLGISMLQDYVAALGRAPAGN
ncbi:photosynthetic reaction center cytochrome PufC [Mongoliimonas terrestris]|uniref:photosynthetic reaction center cytochrome PufC n=1 Tax=Mongoliimonas terrestris TaxID=1709001 RepID=UPI0009498BF2|nr:photosynthetic reaction center cytochrome PufC [Mongoliimonas terrestris]